MTDQNTNSNTKAENQRDALLALHPSAFLTGTRAYGPASPTSDYDICYLCTADTGDFEQLAMGVLQDPVKTESDYFQHSYYITDDGGTGTVFNLIFLLPGDYVCWRKATEMMRLLPPMHTASMRHGTFEMLRAIIHTSLFAGVLVREAIEYYQTGLLPSKLL